MTLEVEANDHHFQYQSTVPGMYIWVRSRNCGCLVTWFCYQLIAKPDNKTAAVSWPNPYDANLVVLAQIHYKLSYGQAEFPRILSQMAKMKVKVNDIHFQYRLRVSQDACLVQVCWFQLRFMSSYRADKVKFADGRTDRRRRWQYLFGLRGQGVEMNMKHFPRYWPFVRGIHWSPVNSPRKGQWRGALMFSLIGALKNGWVNNREAGDLSRHRAHYDVIVMRGITAYEDSSFDSGYMPNF